MIELVLPIPPSVNHYKNVGRLVKTKSGKMYQERFNSVETKTYFCHVMNICLRQDIKSLGKARIKLEIDIYPRTNHRMDISNRIKVLEDSLVHAKCFDDDSQVDWIEIRRMPVHECGKVNVRIKEINHAELA